MAQNLLGTVTANNAISGDFIAYFTCFWDDVTEAVVVKENGVVVTSFISIAEVTFVSEGYTTVDDQGNTRTFVELFVFPFYGINVLGLIPITVPPIGTVEEPGVLNIYDISLRLFDVVRASDKFAADGEIEIIASGSNDPFTYYDRDPRTFIGAPTANPTAGRFTGLPAGNYTFWGRGSGSDLFNFLDVVSIDVTVPIALDTPPPSKPSSTSGYGVRWVVFEDNLGTDRYKTEIFQRGFTAASELVKGASQSYGHMLRAEGKDIYESNILASQVSVNLISQTFDQFKELATSDEKKFIIVRSKFNGVTYDLNWYGYSTPSSYSDVIFDPPYQVSISGNDRLADLNKFDFNHKGLLSQLNIIQLCMNNLGLDFGYRIAVNIFAENHDTTSNTPLNQTFINTDIYVSDEFTALAKCDQVVRDILKIYGAKLFSWEGFWYIIRDKEYLNETINYVQYDSDINFVANGSWNPRIDFKRPKETNRYRWTQGAQSRIYSEVYSKINLVINKEINENGLTNAFNQLNFNNNRLSFFKGYFLNRESEDVITISNLAPRTSFLDIPVLNLNLNDDDPYWEVGIIADGKSSTYISTTKNIDYSNQDSFNLVFKFNIRQEIWSIFETQNFNDYPPFLQLKWRFRVGNLYLSDSGTWSTAVTNNVIFVENANSDFTFDRTFKFPQELVGPQNDDYEIDVFACDILESEANVFVVEEVRGAVKEITTADKNAGFRININVTNFTNPNVLYYYELRDQSDLDETIEFIRPNDFSGTTNVKSWVLIGNWSNIGFNTSGGSGTFFTTTRTRFKEIKLFFLPLGKSLAEVQTLTSTTQVNNNLQLDYNVNQFDLTGAFLNEDDIVLNFLKYQDDTPTSNWKEAGEDITKSIQEFTVDFITSLVKKGRSIVSGNFRTDGVDFTPINVLHDPSDANRLYLPTGVSSNFKLQEYTGEIIEIASGDDVTNSAFTDGFKQNAVR